MYSHSVQQTIPCDHNLLKQYVVPWRLPQNCIPRYLVLYGCNDLSDQLQLQYALVSYQTPCMTAHTPFQGNCQLMDNHEDSHQCTAGYNLFDLHTSEREVSHGTPSKILITGSSLKRFSSLTDVYYYGCHSFSSNKSRPQTATAATRTTIQVQDAATDPAHICRLEVTAGSTSLAEVCEKYKIRWKNCKKCGGENDHTQETRFKSELVLGAEHCLCSTIEHQRQLMENCYSSCTNNSDNTNSSTMTGEDCLSLPILENDTCSSAILIINGLEYFTNRFITQYTALSDADELCQ